MDATYGRPSPTGSTVSCDSFSVKILCYACCQVRRIGRTAAVLWMLQQMMQIQRADTVQHCKPAPRLLPFAVSPAMYLRPSLAVIRSSKRADRRCVPKPTCDSIHLRRGCWILICTTQLTVAVHKGIGSRRLTKVSCWRMFLDFSDCAPPIVIAMVVALGDYPRRI